MGFVDIVLLAMLIIGLASGFMRGFFVELASLVALIAGVYGAFHFSNYAVAFFEERVDWDENTVNIVALVSTFLIIVLVISLAGKALTKIADFAMLGLLNKIMGAIFGCVKDAVTLSVLLIVLDNLNAKILFVKEEDKEATVIYKHKKTVLPTIFHNVIVNGKPLGEELLDDASLKEE